MMAAVVKLAAVSQPEHPDLRRACEAEAEAVARIRSMKARLIQARSDTVLRQRDRDALAGRVARGEAITGADLRKAEDAIADARATVTLLEEALPNAVREAKATASDRHAAVAAVTAIVRAPFSKARDDARAALAAAQAAYERAEAEVREMPAHARVELADLLARHGLDEAAGRYLAEIERIELVNVNRKQAGLPLAEIPL